MRDRLDQWYENEVDILDVILEEMLKLLTVSGKRKGQHGKAGPKRWYLGRGDGHGVAMAEGLTKVLMMGMGNTGWFATLLRSFLYILCAIDLGSNTPEHIIPLRHDLGVLQFVGMGNQGEWPMPVWCRMFQQTLYGKAKACFDKLSPGNIDNWGSLQEKFLNRFGMLKACDEDPTEISKIDWKANYTLPHFKERCVSESNAIPNVPELMQISSFMSSHKCPELTKRFSNNVPKTVDDMLKRVDDYLWSKEAFHSTELPRGEF
nr:reverse transcriptase domain-containing protein [Tanacetum cinerariifolium]